MHYFRFGFFALLGLLLAGVAGAVTLSADTSRPEMSTFIPGETITLTFTVSGLTPADAGLALQVKVVDENDAVITEKTLPLAADAQGNWTTTLAAPKEKMGFYRVYAKLSNGVTLPALGSRPAGFVTYCIVPDPATRVLYPEKETFFGMQGGFNARINVLPYLGIRWVMDGQLGWRRTEPDRAGQFADKVAAAAKSGTPLLSKGEEGFGKTQHVSVNGKETPWRIYLLATNVLDTPNWAGLHPEASGTKAIAPHAEDAWRKYCTAAAKAYATLYPEKDEHIYELTWEPVPPTNFTGTDDDLVRVFEIAYPALHAADPKAVVIGPAGWNIGQGALDWNKSLFKKGIGKYLDGFSIHPYIPLPSEEELLPQKIRDMKEMVRQYSGKDLPFYGTEQGSALRGNPVADLAQAQGMIRTNLIMLGEGFRLNFSFYIHDTGMDGYGYYYGLTPGSVCGTGKTGPKPIAPAYAAQTLLLEGHRSAGPIEWLGDTACGYAYERGTDVVLALWDFGGKPRQVTLPVGVQRVTLYDWMGNARPVATPDGTVTVTLTKAPIYLQGVAPLLWSKSAARPLTLTAARAIAFPGGVLTVNGTVRAPGGKPFTGTLRLEPDPRSGMAKQTMAMVIPAGKAVPFSCKLAVPARLSPGAFPVKVMLEAKGNAVAAAGLALQVRPPLAVERIAPQFLADGRQGLLVQVRDTQGVGNAGTVTAQIKGVPETRKTVPFLLRAGGTQQLALAYADLDVSPFMTYQVEVAVETKGGYRFTQTAPINFFAALRRATAPKIDGDLADWDGVPALTLRGKEFVVRSPEFYTGPDDEAVQLRYAWDAHALYLAYMVTDDTYLQAHTGSMIWQGDCLQLGLNLDAGKALESSGNTVADMAVQQRISEIALALTKDGPQAFRHATFNQDRYPAGLLSPAQLPLAVKRANGRIIYEAAIPWTTLGATSAPGAGTVIGVAATVNDMDDPKQSDPSALGLYLLKRPSSGATYPGGFGVLTLSGTVSK